MAGSSNPEGSPILQPDIDPEHKQIYEGVRNGTISPQGLSQILDRDPLLKDFKDFYGINGFEKRLKSALERGVKGVLIAIDVDYFKIFNDSQGHPAGDDLLRLTAKIIHRSIRSEPLTETVAEQRQIQSHDLDLLARNGGDEFLIFLVEVDTPNAIRTAKRIRQDVMDAAIKTFPNFDRTQTLSLGLTKTRGGDDVRTIRQRADVALYHAKKERGSPEHADAISIY